MKEQLALGILKLAGKLPLGLARAIGSLVGHISWLTGSRARAVTEINLAHCYPDMPAPERRRLARRSLVATARTGMEVAGVWQRDWSVSKKLIHSVHNAEAYDRAAAAGTGVIAVLPHMGNWEMFSPHFAGAAQMTALYAPPKMAALDPVIRAGRENENTTLVPTNRRGVMALFKALRERELVVILPDQEPETSGGAFAPFFGQPALTMTLVHNLIQRTGCRAVFGVALPVEGGFDIHFIEPEEELYSGEQDQALAAMNRGVEACIALAPEQYQWEYKRFRKQPDMKTRLYRK
ncbi:lysophospholipid acyltransferase family protein [Biformimicrobium ophioploci]|uniref:Lysophospholipid acyltransferase n=1 Tax=Biformimicrobium ophioploci TaxID=3036711 RepID=A0ABQ6LVA6_9GAMM|nr:lysophospholipid acyltransferase family protein [Microbulbifer sp. NKW57]GMG86036.1 lysophospholipid acyltransferase [Microbulbifer sp. NKW57]